MARCHELILQQRESAFRNGPPPKVASSVWQCGVVCCSQFVASVAVSRWSCTQGCAACILVSSRSRVQGCEHCVEVFYSQYVSVGVFHCVASSQRSRAQGFCTLTWKNFFLTNSIRLFASITKCTSRVNIEISRTQRMFQIPQTQWVVIMSLTECVKLYEEIVVF